MVHHLDRMVAGWHNLANANVETALLNCPNGARDCLHHGRCLAVEVQGNNAVARTQKCIVTSGVKDRALEFVRNFLDAIED
jgi:hypothetical protein